MATKNIYLLSAETTAPDGSLIYIGKPGGANPDPFEDKKITKANLLKELQAEVDANTADISTNIGAISTINDNIFKRLDSSKTTSYTFTQEEEQLIEDIYFSGTGTVSVGTTLAGEELASSSTITNNFRHIKINSSDGYAATSRTIYVTISGGTVDVAIFSKINLFT
jgi:hypothetical protein